MAGNFFAQYTVTFDQGETIYTQSDSGNCMFVIKDGEVTLQKTAKEEIMDVGTLGKGDFFGELSILENCPRTETARAGTNCTLVVIHRNMFVKMLKSNMEIAIRMLQKFSTKMRVSEETVDRLFKRVTELESQAASITQPNLQLPREKKILGKLVSISSNRVFILSNDRNLVGRYDPVTGIKPEVDLTYEDDTRSVSRRHAVIFRKNNNFFVQEEIGVLNGTFVNGTKARSSSDQIPVHDQDMVNIGMLAFKFYMITEEDLTKEELAQIGP